MLGPHVAGSLNAARTSGVSATGNWNPCGTMNSATVPHGTQLGIVELGVRTKVFVGFDALALATPAPGIKSAATVIASVTLSAEILRAVRSTGFPAISNHSLPCRSFDSRPSSVGEPRPARQV